VKFNYDDKVKLNSTLNCSFKPIILSNAKQIIQAKIKWGERPTMKRLLMVLMHFLNRIVLSANKTQISKYQNRSFFDFTISFCAYIHFHYNEASIKRKDLIRQLKQL
jgi:hypothetical protein